MTKPRAHLGFFRDELVLRRAWLTDAACADLVARCQGEGAQIGGDGEERAGQCLRRVARRPLVSRRGPASIVPARARLAPALAVAALASLRTRLSGRRECRRRRRPPPVALYRPAGTSAITSAPSAALAIVAFPALHKFPPWLVVFACAVTGGLLLRADSYESRRALQC